MTRDQFARTCASMGYCSRKYAEEYAKGRDELTDADYIEVYRRYTERPCAWLDRMGMVDGAHTTKRYMHAGRDMKEEDNR